jgi:hypothetical protein
MDAIIDSVTRNDKYQVIGATARIQGTPGVPIQVGANMSNLAPGQMFVAENLGTAASPMWSIRGAASSGNVAAPRVVEFNEDYAGYSGGDLLLGSDAFGMANFFFDESAGAFYGRIGTTPQLGLLAAEGAVFAGRRDSNHIWIDPDEVVLYDSLAQRALDISATNGIRQYAGGVQRSHFRQDGSGWLGGESNIYWDAYGNLTLYGNLICGEGSQIDGTYLNAYSVTAEKLNMVFGGTNIIQNSTFAMDADNDGLCDGWALYNNNQAGEPITATRPTTGGVDSRHYQRLSWGTNTGYKGIRRSVAFEAMAPYIISFYARGTGLSAATVMRLDWATASPFEVTLLNPGLGATWQRYAFIAWQGMTANTELRIRTASAITGTLEIDHVLVERGDVLQGWKPYPSELEPGSVTADKLYVNELSAIVANLGTVNAGSIVVGESNKLWLNDAADGGLALGGTNKATAPFRVSAAGVLNASSGYIGGWSIFSTALVGDDVTLNKTGYLQLGASNNIVRLDSANANWRMWVGNSDAASAPFRVSPTGDLVAANAKITGAIQASVFEKATMSAFAGGLIVAKSAGKLAAAYTVGGTMTIEAPPGGGWLLDTGDVVRIKATYSGGVGDTWITVTRTATENQYTTTYRAGTNSITYPKGTAVVDYGQSGQGYFGVAADGAFGAAAAWVLRSHAGEPWNGVGGTNGETTHVYAGTDGKLYAGDGAVTIGRSGVSFDATRSLAGGESSLKWVNGSNVVGRIEFWSDLNALDLRSTSGPIRIMPGAGGATIVESSLNYDGDLVATRNSADYTGYIFVPLTTPLTSTSWDGDAFSTASKTLIDLSAVFGVPAGVKAVLVECAVRDSASSGVTSFQGVILGPTNAANLGRDFACNAMPNDSYARAQGVIPCDANGDVYYQTTASGSGTLDVAIEIWGYWI